MQVAPSSGQTCNWCKCHHLVAKFSTNASSAMWWPNVQLMHVAPSGGQICNKCKWCHIVAKFSPSHGVNFWVRCAPCNVFQLCAVLDKDGPIGECAVAGKTVTKLLSMVKKPQSWQLGNLTGLGRLSGPQKNPFRGACICIFLRPKYCFYDCVKIDIFSNTILPLYARRLTWVETGPFEPIYWPILASIVAKKVRTWEPGSWSFFGQN